MMQQSLARVPTPKAERYLVQLCKHFAHRVPAEYDDNSGVIAFDFGRCQMAATPEILALVAEAADPAALAQVQDVIGRHLERFAFRDGLTVSWTAPEPMTTGVSA